MCETCDRHRKIVVKDEPEAFRNRLRRMQILDMGSSYGKPVLNLLYGRAVTRSVRVTEKGRKLLEQLRKDGEV